MLVANLIIELISISLLFFSALYIGGTFLNTLRSSSRVNDFKQNSWYIIAAAFQAPIVLFIILHILSRHGIVAKSWCNSISMGFVIGVFMKLNGPPTGPEIFKLIVKQPKYPDFDVWFDSCNVTVSTAIDRITQTLMINTNVEKVAMESGRGAYITDTSKSLFHYLGQSSKVDFFGFRSLTCFIDRIELKNEEKEKNEVVSFPKNITTPFWPVIPKIDCEYGELYTISIKPPHSTWDTHYVTTVGTSGSLKNNSKSSPNAREPNIYCVAFKCRALFYWPHFRILPYIVPDEDADKAISGIVSFKPNIYSLLLFLHFLCYLVEKNSYF